MQIIFLPERNSIKGLIKVKEYFLRSDIPIYYSVFQVHMIAKNITCDFDIIYFTRRFNIFYFSVMIKMRKALIQREQSIKVFIWECYLRLNAMLAIVI